jgi:hypothetical protein
LPNLREPAAFAVWFRLIIFKNCDRLTRRERPPFTDLEGILEVAAPGPSPHEVMEARATQQSVRMAQLLVARSLGFKDWEQVVTHSEAQQSPGPSS